MSPLDGAREISCLRGLYDILPPPALAGCYRDLLDRSHAQNQKLCLNTRKITDNSYLRLPSISDVSGMRIPPALRHS